LQEKVGVAGFLPKNGQWLDGHTSQYRFRTYNKLLYLHLYLFPEEHERLATYPRTLCELARCPLQSIISMGNTQFVNQMGYSEVANREAVSTSLRTE
jgi:hypothetical protein